VIERLLRLFKFWVRENKPKPAFELVKVYPINQDQDRLFAKYLWEAQFYSYGKKYMAQSQHGIAWVVYPTGENVSYDFAKALKAAVRSYEMLEDSGVKQ